MYTVSQTLQTAINNGTPQRVLLEFTDANAVFSNEDVLVSSGVELDELFNSETDLTIGLCPSAEIRFDMLNDAGQLDDFTFGKFKAWLGARIDSGTPSASAKTKTFTGGEQPGLYEFTPLGLFIAERPAVVRKKILSITANDQMQLFDVDMPDATALNVTYPITMGNLFAAMCAYAGVQQYDTTKALNMGLVINEEPEKFTSATMRDVLGWIAEAACCIARFDRDGVLEMAWFSNLTNTATYDEHTCSDFSPYWYAAKGIDGLHIRNADSTEEYTYGTGTNAYLIQDNPFLRQADAGSAITITKQPISQTGIKMDAVVILMVEASGATGYQWQWNDNGSWLDVSGIDHEGPTTSVLSFKMTQYTSGRTYRCKLSNESVTAYYSQSATVTAAT